MDQSEIVARLRDMRVKQVDIAELLKVSPEKVSKSFSGIRRFTAAETVTLLQFLGEGIEEPRRRSLADDTTERPKIRRSGARMLPVVGLVPAGNWREAVETTRDYMPSPEPNLNDDVFVVEVEGDSMDKIAPAGTRVVIDPADKQLVDKKIYVVRDAAGDVTLKQFMSDPARLVPCSSNEEHRIIILGEDLPGEIVGRAIWRSNRM